MNSTHQKKQFDTNIVRFGGLNRYKQHVSFFIAGIQ